VLAATRVVVDPAAATAFLTAFDNALLFASAVAFVVALASAFLISKRIMRPVAEVREATVRLAEGDYRHHVPVPTETELAALAHDVNVLADRLATTEQRRTRLVGDVAHELRTPLTTIQGSMEALIDGVIEPSEKIFNSVADEAARLQRIVADLGLLSRIDEGVLDLHLQPVDVGTTARTVAARLRPQFDDQAIGLRLDIAEALPVRADADRMAQVFTNLIGNALGHSHAGSTVTVSGHRLESGYIEVTITDEGDGIVASELATIFERFRRGASTRRAGTGLGLSIAQSIVLAHHGSIRAASPGPGHGATFSVRLPAHTKGQWSS
jgi:histidine kinase